MKVLLISNFYPPRVFGGYELYAHSIARGLTRRGHEVYVLTSQDPSFRVGCRGEAESNIYALFPLKTNNFYRTNQVDIFKKSFRFFLKPKNFIITRDIISKLNPDIVSIWNLRLLSIAPLIAGTRSSKPLVIHLYDPWLIPIKIFKPFPWLRDKLMDTGHVITCSRSLARQYEAAGIKKECLTVLPHGIAIYPRKEVEGGRPKAKQLLIISSLSREKGIDTALEALALLAHKRNKLDLSLNIYGQGDVSYRKDLGLIIKREGLEPYVHFKGWIKPELLDEVFARHYIFICPERWATLPLVLLQAMANEMPVIGMNYKGMDEVIVNGLNGLLVPPDDSYSLAGAIERLDRDDLWRRQLGSKARETIIHRFDLEENIRKIESYYLDLIKQ